MLSVIWSRYMFFYGTTLTSVPLFSFTVAISLHAHMFVCVFVTAADVYVNESSNTNIQWITPLGRRWLRKTDRQTDKDREDCICVFQPGRQSPGPFSKVTIITCQARLPHHFKSLPSLSWHTHTHTHILTHRVFLCNRLTIFSTGLRAVTSHP